MHDFPDISVIIPVYNTEEYIEACVDSVLCQEGVNVEVVAVDDGSTDQSGCILDRYAEKYDNVKVIHQENGGISMARNTGIRNATGKYICYLDSDDYYRQGVLCKGLAKCEEEKLDVLFFTYQNYFEDEITASKWKDNPVDRPMRSKEYPAYPLTGLEMLSQLKRNGEYRVNVFLQMANREFIKKHNIHFMEGIIFEDIPYTFEIFLRAERVMAMNEVLAMRRIRDNSLEHRPPTVERCLSAFYGLEREMELLAEVHYETGVSEPEVRQELEFRHQFVQNAYLDLTEGQRQEFLAKCNSRQRIFFGAYFEPHLKAMENHRTDMKRIEYWMNKATKGDEKITKLKADKKVLKNEHKQIKAEWKELKQQNKNLQSSIRRIRSSWTFRVGKIIVCPFAFAKRILKTLIR